MIRRLPFPSRAVFSFRHKWEIELVSEEGEETRTRDVNVTGRWFVQTSNKVFLRALLQMQQLHRLSRASLHLTLQVVKCKHLHTQRKTRQELNQDLQPETRQHRRLNHQTQKKTLFVCFFFIMKSQPQIYFTALESIPQK